MATATQILAKKHKPGRPERYSPELAEAVCNAVGRGLSRAAAGALCKVHPYTINTWIERNKGGFAVQLAKAEAEYKDALIGVLDRASRNSTKQGFMQWQAGAWLLERRFPDEFALRNPSHAPAQGVTINLVLPGGKQQQLTINTATPTTSGTDTDIDPAT